MYNQNANYLVINPILRASTVLTGSFVPATIIKDPFVPQTYTFKFLNLFVGLTLGSLTNAEVIVEFSPDGTNWYQETTNDTDVTTGNTTQFPTTHIFGVAGNYKIVIPISDMYIRVSAKGTGTVTGSLLSINAALSTN